MVSQKGIIARRINIGDTIGAWLVVATDANSDKYLCVCTACEAKTQHYVRKYDLISGSSRMCKSCASSTPSEKPAAYRSWAAMIQRCHNPNSKDYPNYGARGIEVCQLWRDSFDAFFLMVGPRPNPDDTIDRIDSNGNYEPGNVRWASRTEQTRNQRSNINVTIEGVTKTVAEWSEEEWCPVSKFTVYKRIKRGWDPLKALKEPTKEKGE